MSNPPIKIANFGFLAQHDAQLVRLGALAERYFGDDPNTGGELLGENAVSINAMPDKSAIASRKRGSRVV